MPTDRFNRLSDEKKKKIREAAIKEFARVPFEKASINQIIRNADISRGSFYTYFSDKQDVVSFIFEDSFAQMEEFCLKILTINGGDYFDMIRKLFKYLTDKGREAKDMMKLVKNAWHYQDNASLLGLDNGYEWSGRDEDDEQFAKVFNRIDLSQTWLKNKEDRNALMMLGVSSLALSLKQFYQYPDQIDVIRMQLDKKLYLLQYGIYKEPGGSEHNLQL